MDPEVFVTIAYSGYAVLSVLGIGAVLWATSGRPGAAERGASRHGIVVASTPPSRDADVEREEREASG